MKNNYRKLKFSILLQTVLVTALTVLVGGVLLKFVIDGIYNDSFARTFVDVLVFLNINEKTAVHLYWQLIGDNKTFFMIVGSISTVTLYHLKRVKNTQQPQVSLTILISMQTARRLVLIMRDVISLIRRLKARVSTIQTALMYAL